jgi:uncharacterized membrane protein
MRLNKHLRSLLFSIVFVLAGLLHFSQMDQWGASYRAVAQESPWSNTYRYPSRAESFVPFVEERGAVGEHPSF